MAAEISLKNLLVTSKSVKVEFPGFPGFEIELAYLSRETLLNLRKKATSQKLKGRSVSEEVNDELFLQLYVQSAIKGWKGLTLAIAEQLIPLDTGTQDLKQEVPYNDETALLLMKNSASFDSWVSEQVTELGNFRNSSSSK